MGVSEQLPSTFERYEARFGRVLAYLEAHADEPVSVEALSQIAAFSRYHFVRQFAGFLGLAPYRYVQFMRMRRASMRLAYRAELSVQEVAFSAGFEGPEAFARAFRQFTGQSPSEFRADPNWAEWHSRFRPFLHLRQTHMSDSTSPQPVRVVNFPATRVALLEHRGSEQRIGETIRTFIGWRRANKLPPATSATFNFLHNDPGDTPPEQFRLGLAVATNKDIEPNEAGVREFHIPAGRCAVLRHFGSDDHLGRSLMRLYGEWLPGSGEEARDFPLYLQRVKFFPDVPDAEAITDIYLPLV